MNELKAIKTFIKYGYQANCLLYGKEATDRDAYKFLDKCAVVLPESEIPALEIVAQLLDQVKSEVTGEKKVLRA